ncbi:hypothetical protein UFOVP943_39 [uncultured Caudovirales phage]|uniref:Tail completion protein n=1 Tax=uncultured Caudovirales phage TaxID=2100421 RepID=A0A6J5QRN1_9CAUD|nr:hypothetical protein UFOVP943_39 [uncultured Caudovirales phage]CAB4184141.1 hypothetical protein UFOVP1111_34 [uncultured Caudovirales phage]CAB4203357.1 hypothetical protein UFOVP1380_39 [uncultured Caudovirales phage]
MSSVTTVSQIKAGLAANLATVSGLRAYAYQPDNVNTPFAWPLLDSIQYNGAMGGGLITHKFTISVVVGRSAERTAQSLFDGYLSYKGATSIRQAIESDRTLGGVVQDLIVESANNISTLEANDATYLAIDFVVTVYA